MKRWYTVSWVCSRVCSVTACSARISTMASQIISLTIVYPTVCSGADRRIPQSSASLAFVRGIHRWPVNSPHKGPVTRKIFPIMEFIGLCTPSLPIQRISPLSCRQNRCPYNRPKKTWRHNGRDSVSNHQPHDCLLNRLFRRKSKKTSKLRVTGLCAGNSPGTGEFPAEMTS